MKKLVEFNNGDKLRLLHDLFSDEIPMLLDHLQQVCADFREHKESYAKDWNNGFMPFDYWFSLSEQTAGLIKKYRFNMVRSSRVFSDQLSFTYAVIFVNDRIIKYADKFAADEKFKQAVILLFT